MWNTGANGENYLDWGSLISSQFYDLERSNYTGKICSGGYKCNDNVKRTTTWKGIIGLLYPSDYGYAVGLNSNLRKECLGTSLYNWSKNESCYNNNWLSIFPTGEWTMMPLSYTDLGHEIFAIYDGGVGYGDAARGLFENQGVFVRPTLYLKANIKIIAGEGTLTSPYRLELISEN